MFGQTFYEISPSGVSCVDTCKTQSAFCHDTILASIELWHAFDEQGKEMIYVMKEEVFTSSPGVFNLRICKEFQYLHSSGLTCQSIVNITEATPGAPFYRSVDFSTEKVV